MKDKSEGLNNWFYPLEPSQGVTIEDICITHFKLYDTFIYDAFINDTETDTDSYVEKSNMKIIQLFLDSI